MTCFCAMYVLLEKSAFGGNASLELADPRDDTRGSKVPAILRDWHELDVE